MKLSRQDRDVAREQRELCLVEEEPGEESPYARLLGDAMNGDGTLFARENAIEAAWEVVEPILKSHHRCRTYERGSWGPKEADALIAKDSRWQNPEPNSLANIKVEDGTSQFVKTQ